MKNKTALFASIALLIALQLVSMLYEPKVKYDTMPDMAEWEKAYKRLLKNSGIKDGCTPEFFSINCELKQNFERNWLSKSKYYIHPIISAEMVSPDNHNKVYKYSYNLRERKPGLTQSVTLPWQYGTAAKYENFKAGLFNRDFFPSFQEMEDIVKTAIGKSGITENPTIHGFSFETKNNTEGQIKVQVARGSEIAGIKYIHFDRKGNFIQNNPIKKEKEIPLFTDKKGNPIEPVRAKIQETN